VRRHPPTAQRLEVPPSTPASADAWTRAATAETPEAWDAAAEASEREREGCAVDCLEPAYAAVLARKNALMAQPIEPPAGDDSLDMPPRIKAVVDALDAYMSMAPADDPDLAGMKFLAAHATTKWRQPDAIARLEALLREHRDDPSAEYAANLLLDLLARAERIDDLRAWTEELIADAGFLADKPALRATLERLREMLASSP
jgi:hypothetical protein